MRVGPLNVVALYGMVGDTATQRLICWYQDRIRVPFVLARLKFDPDLDSLRRRNRDLATTCPVITSIKLLRRSCRGTSTDERTWQNHCMPDNEACKY